MSLLRLIAPVLLLTAVIACGDDEEPREDPTPTATATASNETPEPAGETPTEEPTAAPTPGELRRTGEPDLDRVIEAVELRDVATLVDLAAFQSVACVEVVDGIGGPPLCEDGETEGTIVQVFPAAYCEGTLLRSPDQALEQFASMARGLYAVTEGPDEEREAPYWPVGDAFIVFHFESEIGPVGGRLVIEDGRIVMAWFGCGSPPEDVAAWRNGPLPVIAGPFPDPLPE